VLRLDARFLGLAACPLLGVAPEDDEPLVRESASELAGVESPMGEGPLVELACP
jgi:hypothetical protein